MIEVLLVVAIAGLLVGTLASGVFATRRQASDSLLDLASAGLNAAVERAQAEGRPIPAGLDADGALARLREVPSMVAARHGGWTGRLLDPSWAIDPVGDAHPGRRITWDGFRFRVSSSGAGFVPRPHGQSPPTPTDESATPEGAGFATVDPWIWDHEDAVGPDATPPGSSAHARLRLELDGVAVVRRGEINTSTPRTLRLVSEVPGRLQLAFEGRTATSSGGSVALTLSLGPGTERESWAVGTRFDDLHAGAARLAVPFSLRVPLSGSLELLPDRDTIHLDEETSTRVDIPWIAWWSNGISEEGLLSLPLEWSPPGGQEEDLPLRHEHRGLVAEAWLRVRHAPRTYPTAWTARVEVGSLPITRLTWEIRPASGGDPQVRRVDTLSPASRGSLISHAFTARLPEGSWRLSLLAEDAAGSRPLLLRDFNLSP